MHAKLKVLHLLVFCFFEIGSITSIVCKRLAEMATGGNPNYLSDFVLKTK